MFTDMTIQSKKLNRNYKNSMFAGVCSGLSEYMGMKVLIIRLIFVLATAITGWGLIVYLLLLFVLPYKTQEDSDEFEERKLYRYNVKSVLGTVFIFAGSYFILSRLGFSYFWFVDPSSSLLLPMAFLFAGYKLMVRKQNITTDEHSQAKELYRVNRGKRLSGVCGGLGRYLDVDPTIVRMILIFSVFATIGLTLIIYVILSIMLPQKQEEAYVE